MIMEYIVLDSNEEFVKWQKNCDVGIISIQAVPANTAGSGTDGNVSLTHNLAVFVTFTRGVRK